jgi:hypothetical protein
MSAAQTLESPLQSVERCVQARAKELAVDMAAAGAEQRMRTLIAAEIAAWRFEYQRGRRTLDIADPAAAAERAWRNLAGSGLLQPLLG